MSIDEAMRDLDLEEEQIIEKAKQLEAEGIRAFDDNLKQVNLSTILREQYEASYIYVPTDELGQKLADAAMSFGVDYAPCRKGLWVYNITTFVFENAEDIKSRLNAAIEANHRIEQTILNTYYKE